MPDEDKDKWYISGKLGIGETEPYAPLVVSGEISLKSPDPGIHSFRFKRTDEDNRVHEWALWHMNKDYHKNALEIWEYKTDSSGKTCDGNPADGAMCALRLAILEGGNVGIANELTVGAGGNAVLRSRHIEGKQGDNDGPDTLYLNWVSGKDVQIGEPSRQSNLFVCGNVGVGTTTPHAPLEVMQTVSGLSTGLQFGGQHAPGVTAGGVINSCDADTTARPLTLQSNGGNIGIGTTEPKAKLDVSGNIALMGKQAMRGDDSWLRLNQESNFSSGVHTPKLFYPGSLNVGGREGGKDPGWGNAWFSGSIVVDGTFNWGGDKSDSGYIILGTLQICWGALKKTDELDKLYNTADVSFPRQFRAIPAVIISLNDPGYDSFALKAGVGANDVTTSGFKILFKCSEEKNRRWQIFSWIAIGKA